MCYVLRGAKNTVYIIHASDTANRSFKNLTGNYWKTYIYINWNFLRRIVVCLARGCAEASRTNPVTLTGT